MPQQRKKRNNRRGSAAARPASSRNGGRPVAAGSAAPSTPGEGRAKPEIAADQALAPGARRTKPKIAVGQALARGGGRTKPETADDAIAVGQALARPVTVDGGPPALVRPENLSPGLVAPEKLPPVLVARETVPPGLVPTEAVPPGLVPTETVPPGLVAARRRKPEAAAKAPPAPDFESDAEGEGDELPGWLAKAAEKLLTVTCWLDPGEHGNPFRATIFFSGQRTGVIGKPRPGDSFTQQETVEGIVPGSGPVAVTAEVRGVNPGVWTVTARAGRGPARPYPPPGRSGAGVRRVPWPRRVVIPASPETTVRSAPLPLATSPGIVRFAYAGLVSLGVLAGLTLQALLLIAGHFPALRPTELSAAAVAAGVVGGKAWFIAVHRGRKADGWCIQGFIAGAAAVVAAAAFAGTGIPAGAYLGTAAAALLIGMAIGRPGCMWAGCCVGRPTASRRGIWASDRKVGCRREPAQLLEALSSLVIGAAVLVAALAVGLQRSGLVAVAGLAAYTLSRQLILGLREDPPQRWRHGRRVTAVAAAVVLIASTALLAVLISHS